MINNYQRDAGTEDDRDSGTISLIASLKPGDQVWVEWRGYGDSFLYSNPYRLISFTGFQITKESQNKGDIWWQPRLDDESTNNNDLSNSTLLE